MHFSAGGYLVSHVYFDFLEKRQEFLCAVLAIAFAQYFSALHIERGKQ